MADLLGELLKPVARRVGEQVAEQLVTPVAGAAAPVVIRAGHAPVLLPGLEPAAPPAASVAGVAVAPAARPPLAQLLHDHWPLLVVAGLVVGGGVLLWRYWEPGAVASREARRMAELDRADRLLRRGSPPPITVPPRRRRRIADGSVA